ncbi:MAG: hypothetical protein WAV72_00025 [Bradyrhizobium sp.]
MDQGEGARPKESMAAEAFAALIGGRQISPFSSRPGGPSIDDAYRLTAGSADIRSPRRKNSGAQNRLHQSYDLDTIRRLCPVAAVDTLSLAPFSEPRIEPEIVFGLSAAPSAQMDKTALSSCIDWVALGLIVQSIFPGWKFSADDTVAANGIHGRC